MRTSNNSPKILLASMPWTTLIQPSLGLSILKSQLGNVNITCKIRHFNLFLLQYLSLDTYVNLANFFACNEFVFTYLFEPNPSEEQIKVLEQSIKEAIRNNSFESKEQYSTDSKIFNLILKLRNQIIPLFLNDCLTYVKEYNPTMIGFTCMYDQTIASLALAKLIKKVNPNIFIVFGGYAVNGIIGQRLMESFPFIDCIAFGAGEYLIENLAKSSIDRTLLHKTPNICYRKKENRTCITKKKMDFDINDSPCPNYDDFLSDINDLSTQQKVDVLWEIVPVQNSRGCWWGEKHHCVFCGIEEQFIKYYYKNPDIVLSNILELHKKYHKSNFLISDYILPHSYYNTLLPKLTKINKDKACPLTFFGEIKANVKEDHFCKLKKAGFKEVQPGIESFSSNILKKINKGISTIQNIYCLILGVKYEIKIKFNVLYGFPDDDVLDYEEMLKVIPLLYHLRPPTTLSQVAIVRDSPIQKQGQKYGLKNPYTFHSRYNMLFSESFRQSHNIDMHNYCYYFEDPFKKSKELQTLYSFLSYQIKYWKNSHSERKVQLYYKNNRKGIIFVDGRYNKTPKRMIFNKIISTVYKECECAIISQDELISKLNHLYTKQEIKNAVDILLENRLVYKENNLLLGLAFHHNIYLSKTRKEQKQGS